jgi:hypothetical protein
LTYLFKHNLGIERLLSTININNRKKVTTL